MAKEKKYVVKKHLQSCEHCQNYQQVLLKLKNVSMNDGLIPNPRIRKHIIQRVKEKRATTAVTWKNSWQHVKNIFEYRIPVYQALVGAAFILIIFMMSNKLSSSMFPKSTKEYRFTNVEIPVASQMNVINNLQSFEHQKIGKNVKEDSVMSQYIVPAM